MNITKKVCIYILVGLITITGTFTSFYNGVYAFEYVGGALAFEEAIKWLLASVGIISAGGMTADYWEQHGDEFVDYCTEQNITDTEVANWQLKLCEGILDKSSACWQAFKEWASTLTGSSSGGGSVEYFTPNIFLNYLGQSIRSDSLFPDIDSNFCLYISNSYRFFNIDHVVINSGSIYLYSNDSHNYYVTFTNTSGRGWFANTKITIDGSTYFYNASDSMYYSNIPVTIVGNVNWISEYDFTLPNDDVPVDSDFISVQPDVTDLDIISSPIPDTDAQEVAIPMPGVSDSDNEVSASAYDDIIDAVNNGQIELDDAITQIQDILKIIVYEEETEKIFPKPDNEEDQENLDDKINQNKDNMGFTLSGLETVFPFCIPWDIYAFMSLLRADPVPPKVELPFPNPLDPENPWLVEVDFADWDDGMRIVRLAEDFLFIIGLAVLTRSLIGAGGGDG